MATSSKNFFKMNPLEKVSMKIEEDGILRTIPALSSYFVAPRCPVQFIPPPKKDENGLFVLGVKEYWLSKMDTYKSHLEWLLTLPHHRFWSQVVYGNDTWDSVISFLQDGIPFYCLDELINEDEVIQETYYIIMNLVFKIFKRICTQKESEESWIGDKKYGSLLYNYTILSVPIFLDLCIIFGGFNLQEVKKMIISSFEAQPLYREDFNNSVQYIKTIFYSTEEQFSLVAGQITKLGDKKTFKELSLSSVRDIVFYSLDITVTLSTFIECYLEAARILHNHRFEVNIASFYDSVVSNLYRRIQETCDKEGNMDVYFILMFKLNQTRYYLIQLYQQCIQSVLNSFEIKDGAEFIAKEFADNFLDILTDCLLYKIFIHDYGSKFPLEVDLEQLWRKCPDIDNTKYNFLMGSLLMSTPPKIKQNSNTQNYGASTSSSSTDSVTQLPVVYDEVPSALPKSEEVQGVELESLVTEVKDILPHLGDGFVKKCLKFYNYSSSSVINAILENNLPEALSSLNHTLTNEEFEKEFLVVPKILPSSEPEIYIPPENVNPYFPNRINVFDNDEFDIMTRDHVDTSRIFRGKRNDPKERDLKDILNDKTFREDLRNKFSILGLIEEAENYDDEYDDTYDDPECPVLEAGEQNIHKFVTPRVLEQAQKKEYSKQLQENGANYQEYSGDENEETSHPNKSDLFIENPEVVRARYEEQRMKRWKQGKPGKDFNVIGNPKGQGQGQDVLLNRNKKTVNKSFQANHNRKKTAQFKRFQGI